MARPAVVTAIVLIEFAKAGVILLASWLLWQRPGPEFRSGVLWQLSDLLTAGRSGLESAGPVFAAYALGVGYGLWFLEQWARRALMVTSALSALYWMGGSAISGRYGYAIGNGFTLYSGNPQSLYTVVFVDAAVFLYLSFGRDVPEAFHYLDPPHM